MAASVCRTYQGAARRGLQMCMLSGMLAMSVGGADNKKPHLFYILADDYGWANVGFHSPEAKTPNIDRLATTEGFELRHLYAYRFCSPCRSAIMSGRLPYHVNQDNSASWGWDSAAVHVAMKMLPEKLGEAGYYTVQSGKWHMGLARQSITPAGRGFNESLTMLSGSEDHFTQHDGGAGVNTTHVDLWATNAPATGLNGTYSADLFGGFAVESIKRHAAARPNQPMFMYLAFTVTHEPIEAPQKYIDMYPANWIAGRRTYMAMASALDDQVGAVVAALKSTGMWANSLVLFSADNGGPSLVGGASFANNYPLRGSKGNAFEGGTRVLAAVSGGLVPSSRFNKKLPAPGNGHVHVADVYATFCGLAQHPDCVDRPGGRIPPSESFDLWPFISGQTDVSPRNESVLEFRNSSAGPWTGDTSFDAALVQGDFKYVQGRQGGTGYWWGPEYPNSTAKVPMDAPGCPLGCLYNITEDETEHVDLSAAFPLIKRAMQERLFALGATRFQSDADGKTDALGAEAAAADSDWWQPWLK